MTYKEKLEMERPDINADIVVAEECPTHYFGDEAEWGECNAAVYSPTNCAKCWARDVAEANMDSDPDQLCISCWEKGPVIKDSGDRTQFASGAVRDMHEGKGRMDLLPWAAIMEVSKHCEDGAIKYGEHNVDKGIPTSSLCDSAARHLAKYLDGWTDEPHLRAAAWNLLWAIQMDVKNKDMVNTPWRADND